MANPNWVKGVSGNPKGPPEKQDSLTYLMRTILNEPAEGDKKTRARKFVEGILNSADKGNDNCRKLVMQYIEGMPQQRVDMTSQGEQIGVMVYMPKKD